jgi:pyruvate/2-oxoglutarate dehydrogenase complex dihydrolipoamide dehydrogenase (E3) component
MRDVVEQDGRTITLDGTHLLVATGRRPNTERLGLELAGIQVNPSWLPQGQRMARDNRTGVWAIGEVAGSPQFTHVSVDDFRIVRDNLTVGHR